MTELYFQYNKVYDKGGCEITAETFATAELAQIWLLDNRPDLEEFEIIDCR